MNNWKRHVLKVASADLCTFAGFAGDFSNFKFHNIRVFISLLYGNKIILISLSAAKDIQSLQQSRLNIIGEKQRCINTTLPSASRARVRTVGKCLWSAQLSQILFFQHIYDTIIP